MSDEHVVREVELSQLHPAPWNPRTIKDERFQNLCKSIQADRAFLWRRPVLATLDGTIYAGNMRYRAAEHLGLTAVPAVLDDIPAQLARERALRDNQQWGDWDDPALSAMLDTLAGQGAAIDLLGFDGAEIDRLLGLVAEDAEFDVDEEWGGMPAFSQEDLLAWKRLIVNFENAEDLQRFAELIGNDKLSPATRSIWYPAQEPVRARDDVYVSKGDA